MTLTDEFVEAFADDEKCAGVMAKFIGYGFIPDGVDTTDERVQKVVARCRRVHGLEGNE